MKRREFITLLGGAAAWPLAARAQQPPTPIVGFLSARSSADSAGLLIAFHKGLKEAGYVEGQNAVIDYRFAEGQYDRLPALAADLVNRQVAAIAAISGTPAALAAKAATTTIPIVFANGADPVASGLVPNLSRPSGNISGVTFLASETIPKRLEVLHELVPKAHIVGYLVNPINPITEGEIKDTAAAANARGLQLLVHSASTKDAIDEGFATFVQRRISALIIGNDTFLSSRKEQISHSPRSMQFPRSTMSVSSQQPGACYPMEPTLLIPIVRLASMSVESSTAQNQQTYQYSSQRSSNS